jgi:hypothetical protein
VVLLNRALYGCVESAALREESASAFSTRPATQAYNVLLPDNKCRPGNDRDTSRGTETYVNVTKERGVILRPGRDGIIVKIYIDASYGVHADGKSHTGSCIVVGVTGAVHCKSSKQQIVTTSSAEAELVALSDSASQGLHMRSFIIAQGYECGPMTVYQNDMSTMALIERGRSAAERTRHIDIRYFWVKERIDMGEAIIKHLGTKDMFANVLTKPLKGLQFITERDALTGWI